MAVVTGRAAVGTQPPGSGGSSGSGGGSSTNEAKYMYANRGGGVITLSTKWANLAQTSSTLSNFTAGSGGYYTNRSAGYYNIAIGGDVRATNNDTITIALEVNGTTNGTMIGYLDYRGASGGVGLSTNRFQVEGIVYLAANTAIRPLWSWFSSTANLLAITDPFVSAMAVDTSTGSGGGSGTVDPTNAVLVNIIGTGAVTNQNSLTLHSNAVKYATERGLTNREAISDISGFFWTLQNNGLLPAFHDAAFLRGGQNAETNIAVRFTYRGSNGTSYASPVQTDKGILTGSGGGGYNFPTEDLSSDFTLIFSGQTGAGGQTAYSHMISYTHSTGSTNFGISIGHDVNNANVVVRSNNTTAVYAANYFGHLFTDYLRDDYPFPFTAGFGYQRSGLLTNWHNGYLGTNSSGNHPLSGLTLITVGGRLDDASPGYAQSWTGTAHAWLLFNRQLSSNEVKQVEIALRWLAPTTHNEIAVGDSTSANIYTKQAESWSYQWFTGPGTNLGEYYIAAASGRSAVSMNSLWDDTVTRRKPQGKVKTATARIWAGINDIYSGAQGQTVWETVSNMTVKAVRDGVSVEIGTLYPSAAYDASMRVQWTNFNNQIISNQNMFKKVYRRDLMFTVTNGVMWYDFLHLSTNGLAEVVKDMALGGAIGWGKVLPTYPVGAGAGKVLTSDANGVSSWAASSGGAQTPWAQNIDGATYSLTNVGSIEQVGDGSTPGSHTLYGTNNVGVAFKAAISNSVPVTNVVGLVHKAYAAYIAVNCNLEQDVHITNRIAGNVIVDWLNAAQGQTLKLRLHGAASGGTDYFVTNTFPSGWLAANQSSNTAPLAVQLPVSVLDGTGAELNIRNYRLFTGTTNIAGAIINTYTE